MSVLLLELERPEILNFDKGEVYTTEETGHERPSSDVPCPINPLQYGLGDGRLDISEPEPWKSQSVLPELGYRRTLGSSSDHSFPSPYLGP